MKGQFKNVFKQSFIYGIGNMANKVIGFILLPLYTSHLTIDDYGMLGLLEATAMILVAVLSLRIPTAMIRWCSDTDDEEEQKSILFTSFFSLLLIVLILNLCLQPFAEQFAHLFFQEREYTIFFQLLFASIGFEILSKIPLEFLRFKEKPVPYISINLTKLVIVLGLNIYLIAFLQWGIKGILVSQLIGHGFVLLLTSKYLLNNFAYSFNKTAAWGMASYGFPLVFSTLSAMLLTLSDRYILPYFHEYGDLGIYNLGYKIASVTNVFLITSFQLGFLPIAFKRFKEPEFEPFLSKVLTYFSFLIVVFTIILAFFSKEIIVTFSRNIDYHYAYNFVPIIGFLFIFKAIQYVFTLGLHFTKKTKFNINITITGLIINVILNILLIPKYNIYGAIVASIISGLVTLLYSYRLSMRFFPVKYELHKIFQLVVICIICTFILYVINPLPLISRLIIKIAIIGLLLLGFIALGFFEKHELDFGKRMLKKLRHRF